MNKHVPVLPLTTRSFRSWLVVLCVLLCLALPQTTKAVWETLLDGTEFNSQSAFEAKWNYNYPWGQTHNGSAKMWQSNDTFSAGVLTMQSVPFVDGTYNYSSGTVYSKWQVVVNSTYPTWDISGDFQCASQRGTWPAFWVTGANTWPPEVDQMEFKGSTTCWQNTYDGAWESLGTTVSSPGSWHTYRVVLSTLNATDVSVALYIDGVLKTTQTGSGFVGQPMWLIIDYQMEGSSGSPGPNVTTYMRGKNVILKRDSQVTSPPPVPGNVLGTPGNQQAALIWSASANATTYNVKRATSSGGPYATIATGLISTRYVDASAVNGNTYYYVVSAVDAIGESGDSTEVSASPAAYINIGDLATASSVQTGNEIPYGTDGDLATRWTASASTYPQWWRVDLGSVQPVTKALINWYGGLARSYKYIIETSTDDINYTTLVDQTGRTTTGDSTDTFSVSTRYVRVTVTGVSPSGGYAAFYECQLFNGGVPQPPAAPTGLTATDVSSSQINLSWTASSGATSYNVKRATVSGGSYTTVATGVTTTNFSDTGLSDSTTYYYVVSAVNAGGESANSTEATATTIPQSPAGLAATGGNAVVNLVWVQSSSPGITQNKVYRSTAGSGGPYNLLATLTATTSYSDTAVVNGSTYYYTVSAVNAAGESALSAYAGATPSAPAPPLAPSNLTATGAKRKVTITWMDNSSNENGFKIERSTNNVNFTQITTVAPNTISYANTGLTSGTTYYYRVRAYNTNGDSAYSNTASATAK